MKFPINERVKVDSTEKYDFYIMHCNSVWYVEAFRKGTLDTRGKTVASFSTLKSAKQAVECWKSWM